MTSARVRRSAALLSASALTLLLGACGGGGGGSVAGPAPGGAAGPATGTGAAASPGNGTLSFTIAIPAATTTSSTVRTPKYVSPSTASITVTLAGQTTPLATENLSAGAPGCTATATGTSCTVTVSAPAGSDTFAIAAWDGPNGTGHQLSVAKVPATISTSSTTTVPLALQGVVATVTALLGSTSIPVGAPGAVSITIVAYDGSGNIIVGPGNFSSPVTLTDTDASGNTSLSTTTVPAPGTSVTLNYNGNSVVSATVTPSINGTPGTAAIFAPTGDAVTNFTTPGQLGYVSAMAAGPDGNMWFTAYGCCESTANIAKIAPNGAVTAYSNNTPSAYIYGLARSSDGASLWFGDENGDIGRIDTSGNVTYASTFNTPCESETTTCGEIDYMVLGPDGNDWFSDCNGYVGYVTPQGNVTEFAISTLPGWPGGGFFPEQIAFGSDGNLYVADELEAVEQITLSGDAPSSVVKVQNPANCDVYALAIGPDGNPWFGDTCANVGMLPLTNFSGGALLQWSLAAINNDEDIQYLIGSPGGLWATDDEDGNVYQIANLSGVSAAQGPSITPVAAFAYSNADAYVENLGPDNNLWVATDSSETPAIAKVIYGAPPSVALSSQRSAVGTLSTRRLIASISHVKHPHSRRGRGRGPKAHTEMHGHPSRPKPQ
jgi:streptogramin lyase